MHHLTIEEKIINAIQNIRSKSNQRVTSFFINPIPPESEKNDGPDSVERVHKSPELSKTIKKLESSADHDLGNIQNTTPSMHLINTPPLYRKDNLCRLSSNICTDHRFFHEVVPFLGKQLDNKQKTINNLLNVVNYMHKNSNEPGNNSYKTANARSVQINATAGERSFQTQKKNNLTVKNNA